MKKLLLLSLLLTTGCYTYQKVESPPQTTLDDERAVKLVVECGDRFWTGSGYIADHESLVTAAHVIDCSDPGVTITMVALKSRQDLTSYPRVMVEDVDVDVGVINYGWDVPPTNLADPVVGEQVCFFPATPKRGQKCGYILDIDSNGKITTTADVIPGNSGSLLFNSAGSAVGVIFAYNPLFGYGYASKL